MISQKKIKNEKDTANLLNNNNNNNNTTTAIINNNHGQGEWSNENEKNHLVTISSIHSPVGKELTPIYPKRMRQNLAHCISVTHIEVCSTQRKKEREKKKG